MERSRELHRRAREGDADSLDRLFEEASEPVLLFIGARLGSGLRQKEDPMDVLQETFVEAHLAFDTFEYKKKGSFRAWLCRIAENRIRGLADHHGAAKRQAPGEPVRFSRVIDRVRANRTGPVTVASRQEQRMRLARALAELADEEREALLQRHFLDRTFDEIAGQLDMPASTVRRNVGRATKKLGAILGSTGGAT